jgi:hypothetical protein
MFQRGWNHQPVKICIVYMKMCVVIFCKFTSRKQNIIWTTHKRIHQIHDLPSSHSKIFQNKLSWLSWLSSPLPSPRCDRVAVTIAMSMSPSSPGFRSEFRQLRAALLQLREVTLGGFRCYLDIFWMTIGHWTGQNGDWWWLMRMVDWYVCFWFAFQLGCFKWGDSLLGCVLLNGDNHQIWMITMIIKFKKMGDLYTYQNESKWGLKANNQHIVVIGFS